MSFSHHQRLGLQVPSVNARETKDDNVWITVCPKFWVNYLHAYLHLALEVDDIKIGRHSNSKSLLFVLKVMVWHFWRVSWKVMTTFIVLLASKCCCGVFSAILYICWESILEHTSISTLWIADGGHSYRPSFHLKV